MLKRLTEKIIEQSTPRYSEEVKKEAIENVGATATSAVKEIVPVDQTLIKARSRMICGTDKITTPADLKSMKVIEADEGIGDVELETTERTTSVKKKKKHKPDVLSSLPPVRVAATFGPGPAKFETPTPLTSLQSVTPEQRLSLGALCSKSLRDKTAKIQSLLSNGKGRSDFVANAEEIVKLLNEVHENLTKNRRALVEYEDAKYSGKSDAARFDDLLDLMKSLYKQNENGDVKVRLNEYYIKVDTAVQNCSDAVFIVVSGARLSDAPQKMIRAK